MESTARFDVRVAGGLAIVSNSRMTIAAAKALDAARQGYRVWIRERSRQSWAAETIVVVIRDGELIIRTTDSAQPRYLSQFTALIHELEAA